jgi:uncharacterized protein (DUF2141 family)
MNKPEHNMIKKYKLITLLYVMFVSSVTIAQTSGTLTISAHNFKGEKGKAVVQLFRKGDDIPEKPFMKLSARIKNGKAEINFQDLPFGEYAAILFYDENENGILDHKWGFPDEAMGFSNDWKLTLFSGMPSFEKLKFEFTQHSEMCDIKIK